MISLIWVILLFRGGKTLMFQMSLRAESRSGQCEFLCTCDFTLQHVLDSARTDIEVNKKVTVIR